MSVINQMLKDLDRRQSASSEMKLTEALHLHSQSGYAIGRHKQALTWGFLLLSVGLLCVFIWQKSSMPIQIANAKQNQVISVLTGSSFQQAANEIKNSKENELSANHITEVNWMMGASGVSLFLYLDGLPEDAFARRTLENGEIEFLLPLLSLDTPIPMLDPNNGLLESYRVGQRDNDLVITVKAKDNVELTAAIQQENSSGQPIAWVLNAKAMPNQKQAEPIKLAKIRNTPQSGESKTISDIKKPVSHVRRAPASYQRALSYLQADRISAAIDQLQKVLANKPQQHDARELLANIYRQTGRSTEANVLLQQGIALDKTYIPFTRLYADSLIASGRLDEADRILLAAAAYVSDDPDYSALQAAVAQRLARHDNAVTYYMQALEIRPQRSAWWMGLAISLEALNKSEAAKGAYAAAIDSGQLNAELSSYVNSRLQMLGQVR